MIEIGAAISSLAALRTIFEGSLAMRDESKLMEVRLAFQQQLIEVQNTLLAMQNALAQAQEKEHQFAQAERRSLQFDEDMKGYQPFEAAPGVFVYAPATDDGSRPKLPYFCYPCYKERKQSILSIDEAKMTTQRSALVCTEKAAHRFELPRHWRRSHVANGVPSVPDTM